MITYYQSEEKILLVLEVRKVLRDHGYKIACEAMVFNRMAVPQLKDILRSWKVWDERKAYYGMWEPPHDPDRRHVANDH